MQAPEDEYVVAPKEVLEAVAHRVIVKDRLGPAFTCTEHIAVGESTARDEAAKLVQSGAARKNIRHVDVVAVEAGAVKGRRHFLLAVHPLLAQHGDPGAAAARTPFAVIDKGKTQADIEARIRLVLERIVGFTGAFRIVPEPLHAVGQLGPAAIEPGPRRAKQRCSALCDDDFAMARDTGNHRGLVQAVVVEHSPYVGQVALPDLYHHTELLVKEIFKRPGVSRNFDVQPGAGPRTPSQPAS